MPRLIAIPVIGKNPSDPLKLITPEQPVQPIQSCILETKTLLSINDNDVISGRGKHVFNHYGNIQFMSLVKRFQLEFDKCQKAHKPILAEKIYRTIQELDPPGRFLKLCSKTTSETKWVEMDKKAAIMKIRQAMRDSELRNERRHKLLHDYMKTRQDRINLSK